MIPHWDQVSSHARGRIEEIKEKLLIMPQSDEAIKLQGEARGLQQVLQLKETLDKANDQMIGEE